MNPISLDQPWGRGFTMRHQHAFVNDAELPSGLWLPRGLGRSYGDVCLNDGGTLLHAFRRDRLIAFDTALGVIDCEAGASLADIAEVALPHGWFLPVTPGTRFVTVGGAIANDVHGKNHLNAGTFGRFVRTMSLRRSDGAAEIGPDHELFRATIGGLGLTGLIERARIQLMRVPGSGITQQTRLFGRGDARASIDEFMALEAGSSDWPYTVGWIDTMHHQLRGVFFRGKHDVGQRNWASPTSAKWSLPVDMPSMLLGGWSARAFNGAYYRSQSMKTAAETTLPLWNFFYPLDAIGSWNRAYGKRGFVQYQFVVPKESAPENVAQILNHLRTSKVASYLAVIKTFGELSSRGLMSFPMPGVTVALDIPAPGERELRALDRADAMVADMGGRVYPAKDSRMSAVMFKRFFPQWSALEALRDPQVSSSFWQRVALQGDRNRRAKDE